MHDCIHMYKYIQEPTLDQRLSCDEKKNMKYLGNGNEITKIGADELINI